MTEKRVRDWYIQEWCQFAGKRQTHLVTELGLTKGTAFNLWHKKQPYSRDYVNMIADWLGIEPHELLMRPEEATALRRLRETAAAIVGAAANADPPAPHSEPERNPIRANR